MAMSGMSMHRQQGGSAQVKIETIQAELCQLMFKHYSRVKAERVSALLEPLFAWGFDLALPAIDLEEQTYRALFWLNRLDLGTILVISLDEWQKNFFNAKTDLARLEATAYEHVQKLEKQTKPVRTVRQDGWEIELDLYEWLYKQSYQILGSHAFSEFDAHLQNQIGNAIGPIYSSLLHSRLLEIVCLPCMYLLAGLDEEAGKCEAELKLFLAGTPLVGIKSLQPVILAKSQAALG